MIVIPRKVHEAITIGDEIEIVVVAIRGDKVRLGISAPMDVPVLTREMYDALRRRHAPRDQPENQDTSTNPGGQDPS